LRLVPFSQHKGPFAIGQSRSLLSLFPLVDVVDHGAHTLHLPLARHLIDQCEHILELFDTRHISPPKILEPLRRELGKAVLQASLIHVAPVTAPRSPNNGPGSKTNALLAPSAEKYLDLISAFRRCDSGRK